jgi:ABC-type transporter Mla subunit MlaD
VADVAAATAAPWNTAAGGNYNAVCLVLVNTGQPSAVRSFSQGLAGKLTTLAGLLSQLEALKSKLTQVWTSTQSSPAAAQKLTDAFATFARAIDAINAFIKTLQTVADTLDKAMDGANQAVQRNDPQIGQLLSNPAPASQAAARTRAAIMTGATSGFLQGQQGALTGTAGTVSGSVLSSLGSVLSSVGQLMGGSGTTTTPAATTPVGLPAPAAPAVTGDGSSYERVVHVTGTSAA